MNKPSRTDWQKLESMTDVEIDYSDIPPLGEDFFARATVRRPEQPQVVVTLEVDSALFAWFDVQEDGWECRMRAALQMYAEAHREPQPIAVP